MKMRSVDTVVEIFLLISAVTLASTENASPEDTTVHVGVHVIYDREIYDSIRNPHGHEHPDDVGTPNDYFAAFLASVQLTFRDMKKLNINISLVNSTLLNDDKRRDVLVSHSRYYYTIDGNKTLQNLYAEVANNSHLYKGADILFLVTKKYISMMFDDMDLNFGVPETGGVCDKENNIGLVTDDGNTFRGVLDMALQAAVLLGASLKGNCSEKGNHMPPSVFAKGRSTLSDCSEKEIHEFLLPKKDTDVCWKTAPETVAKSPKVLPAVYNNITRYDVCTAGTTADKRDVRKCEPGDGRSRFNRTCQVQCCEYNSWFARKGQPLSLGGRKLADGAPCGDNQICINGKCEEKPSIE